MSKIGLCVRYDCNNYGSMLQIFATQKVIENMGCEYEHIVYDKKTVAFMIKNINRVFNPYFMKGKILSYKKNKQLKSNPKIQKLCGERQAKFKEYRKAYIGPYSPIYKGYSNLTANAKKHDIIMVGSDQLWTPAGLQSKFFNLLFVPNEIRKVSFATSFGVTEIPKNQVKQTAKYLDRIDYLSVRESSGAKIIKDLTGKESVVALDPTLLFTGEEWEQYFPTKEADSEPYIFAYFLGTNKIHRDAVNKLANETKLKVITCPLMDEYVEGDLTFGDEQRFNVGPVEFLNLIRGATYVCTDSFHGTVFSILNHKQFLTFDRYSDEIRKSKNNRISSLFNLLGLENRHCTNDYGNIVKSIQNDIDFQAVDKKLTSLRKETFDFLEKALSI